MADRAYMYCPFCRNQGNARAELQRDNVDMFCLMGHRAPHAQIMAMNPEMIPAEVHFKPGPHDVKAEVWVNQDVLMTVKSKLGERFHPTMASIIRTCMAGEPVIIDGVQAEKLRKLGIRNGQEMVATAEEAKRLAAENEDLAGQVNKWERRIAEAMTGA